jgi:hypothetical protein
MTNPINILRLPAVLRRVNLVNSTGSALHRRASDLITEVEARHGISAAADVPPVFRLKMQWYMAEVSFFCSLMAETLGLRVSERQSRLFLISGAVGAIVDYLADDANRDAGWLMKLAGPAGDLEKGDHFSRVFQAFMAEFHELLEEDHRPRSMTYFSQGLQAQIRSRRQFDPLITQEEADSICREKGGISFVFMRSVAGGDFSADEERAWYELGAFIQFCNDAQDLYKDGKKGISTFASLRPDLYTVVLDLETQKATAFSMIKQLEYDEKRKDYFLFIMNAMAIGILTKLQGFSRVCGGLYTREKFLSLSKEEARVNPFSFSSLRYALPKLMSYRYETVDKPFSFSLVS